MLLHDKLKPYRLILASQSPRRQQLLAESGLPYEPAPRYDCQEVYPATLAATQVPRYLSQLKSRAYPRPLAENEILLTADTVVILNGEVLGKPEDREDAIRMLERLSGPRHTVVTGVTLRTARRRRSFSVRSNVWFRALTREEIVYYVDNFHPLDKAGSYGIQGYGAMFVSHLEGDYFSVMGLPLCPLCRMLRAFGVPILDVQEAQA